MLHIHCVGTYLKLHTVICICFFFFDLVTFVHESTVESVKKKILQFLLLIEYYSYKAVQYISTDTWLCYHS